MKQSEERNAKLREGESRFTVKVTPWNGEEFTVKVRGFSVEQAASRAKNFYCAACVVATVAPIDESSRIVDGVFVPGAAFLESLGTWL